MVFGGLRVTGFCGVLRTVTLSGCPAERFSATSLRPIKMTLPRGIGEAGSVHQSFVRTRLANEHFGREVMRRSV
jgi:hypothetical protein